MRLAPLLPHIVSLTHSGFVLGQVIHDNFLLVQELVHDLNRRARGNNVVLIWLRPMIICLGILSFRCYDVLGFLSSRFL